VQLGLGLLPKYDPDTFAALVARAEAAGFDAIWVPDEKFYREVYAELAVAAVHSRRVTLGTAITEPYSRHPAQTATAIATIDELSGGRAILGLAMGVSGFREMGIQRTKPLRALREATELVRALTRGEGPVTYEGQVVRFFGGQLSFRPRRQIPVYIAGAGPKVMELAGEIGDGVIMGDLASATTLAYGLRHVAAGAARAGRSARSLTKVVWLQTFLHPDPGVARETARWVVAAVIWGAQAFHDELGVPIPAELRDAVKGLGYDLTEAGMSGVARHVPPELVRHFALAGTPAEVIAQAREIQAAGADQLAIHPWPCRDVSSEAAIDLFIREVMPSLR
jgi:5,10-methylenetetrahydromethanopterin reductase